MKRSVLGPIVFVLLGGALLFAASFLGLELGHRRVDVLGLAAATWSFALGVLVLGLVREEPARTRRATLASPAESGFARYRFHRERIRWSLVSDEHFDDALRPLLAELAADRLRRHEGIELRLDGTARTRLSTELAAVVLDGGTPPRSAAALEELVEEIERL